MIMDYFRVVFHGVSHKSLVLFWYAHEPFIRVQCTHLDQENTCDKWDTPWYTMKEQCITISHHAIENTVANTNNGTYMWRTRGMLGVIIKSLSNDADAEDDD